MLVLASRMGPGLLRPANDSQALHEARRRWMCLLAALSPFLLFCSAAPWPAIRSFLEEAFGCGARLGRVMRMVLHTGSKHGCTVSEVANEREDLL